MEDMSNKPVEGVGNEEGNTQAVQTQNDNPGVIPEESYKSLESEYTRTRQALIRSEVRLAQADPKRIVELGDDVKLQNAVIKEIFGLSNVAEVKAVYGETFYETKDGVEEDEVAKIKRELNLLKYKSTVGEVESAISSFKAKNPNLFVGEESESKLKDAMELISKDIPLSDRIALASKIAFGNVSDPTRSAYRELAKAAPSGTGGASATEVSKSDKEKKTENLRSFFKLDK